jgi:hypothetical protein
LGIHPTSIDKTPEGKTVTSDQKKEYGAIRTDSTSGNKFSSGDRLESPAKVK